MKTQIIVLFFLLFNALYAQKIELVKPIIKPTTAPKAMPKAKPKVVIKEVEKNNDYDGDGITDDFDKCPNSWGTMKNEGCPDSDGDGIADHIDKCPNEKGVLSNYGCVEINYPLNKNEEAIKLLKLDIQQNPNESKYYNLVQLLKDNSVERKKYINEGLSKYPNSLDLIIVDVNVSLLEKNNANAKVKLQKAIEINPKNHQFYLILGNILESEKDSENAKKNYLKAIEVNPSDFESNYNLAVIQYNEAIHVYNQNISNEKGSEVYMLYFKTAQSTLERCKILRPLDKGVDKLLQRIYEIK